MTDPTGGPIDLSGFIAAAGLPELTPWQRHLIDSLPTGTITVDFTRDLWPTAPTRFNVPWSLVNPEFLDWLDREKRRCRARWPSRLSRIHAEYHRKRK